MIKKIRTLKDTGIIGLEADLIMCLLPGGHHIILHPSLVGLGCQDYPVYIFHPHPGSSLVPPLTCSLDEEGVVWVPDSLDASKP